MQSNANANANSNPNAPAKDRLKGWSRSDRYHYDAAENYLGFDNWRNAMEELSQIKRSHWHHPAFLCAKSRACALAHNWDLCADAAFELCHISPSFPYGWIRAAFAYYKCDLIAQARNFLSSVAHKFPGENIIPWHLALYSFELDDFKSARKYLREAIRRSGFQPEEMLTVCPELRPLCRWLADHKSSQN